MTTITIRSIVLAGALAFSAAPAVALPGPADSTPAGAFAPADAGTQAPADAGSEGTLQSEQGTSRRPTTPGPGASPRAKARAYGKYCANQSRKHVEGERGTPFSLCVTAMARVANGKANPRTACKTESRKHVDGEKGTPFSRCVSGAARLLADQREDEESTTAPAEDGASS